MNPLLIFGIILIIVIRVAYKMFVGRYDRRGVYEDDEDYAHQRYKSKIIGGIILIVCVVLVNELFGHPWW